MHVVGIGCLGGVGVAVCGARLVSAESNLGHALVRWRFSIVGLVFFIDCVGMMLLVSHSRFAPTAIMRRLVRILGNFERVGMQTWSTELGGFNFMSDSVCWDAVRVDWCLVSLGWIDLLGGSDRLAAQTVRMVASQMVQPTIFSTGAPMRRHCVWLRCRKQRGLRSRLISHDTLTHHPEAVVLMRSTLSITRRDSRLPLCCSLAIALRPCSVTVDSASYSGGRGACSVAGCVRGGFVDKFGLM